MQKKKTTSSPSPSTSCRDVDLFAKASTSSSVRRSPVKTNPFEDPIKDRKATKLHPHTPAFGPALSKKSSRTLTGTCHANHDASGYKIHHATVEDEKRKALKEFGKSEKDSIVALLRNDLADSSDEEERRNPLEEKYNDFGKQIRRISRAQSLPGATSAAGENRLLCLVVHLHINLVRLPNRGPEETAGFQPSDGRHTQPLSASGEQDSAQEHVRGEQLAPPRGQSAGGQQRALHSHARKEVRASLHAEGSGSSQRPPRYIMVQKHSDGMPLLLFFPI